ncbi:inorganic phosphate transporter [soil metagenome]
MFELEFSYTVLLVICLIAACAFEFVNGFHDTANAVATVIYTNSLKPWIAVIWSGFMNAVGVITGGIAVAMAIVNLLPVESLVDQNIAHSIAMVAALLLSAIFWNLLTWWMGIPCSSSHTLIGSILGVGIAYSFLPGASTSAVNWAKAEEMGLALLISPLIGFALTIILMYALRVTTKGKSYGDDLFKEPKKNAPPPLGIRATLILTCTFVSLYHGKNDGQKGVGLIMLILIGIVPGYFALNANFDAARLADPITRIETVINSIDPNPLSETDKLKLKEAGKMNLELREKMVGIRTIRDLPKEGRFQVRKDILLMDRHLNELSKKEEARLSEADRKILKDNLKNLREVTDYSPFWVIVMIALSLGFGTMIGWKRIVKTIGEKIGKEHLTYAQGASAEFVAACTIGLASSFGLPVSTTHVLSSGIAGSMVASKGVKNLQPDTVRNIIIAWCLTVPVVVILSGTLFLIFRSIF